MFKRLKILLFILVITALFAAGAMAGPAIASQKAATPRAHDKVEMGEAEAKQLLLLMDQDKDGKVSKQEFMRFMEAEFDRLDKKNEGKLDVKELTRELTRSQVPSGVLGK
jgi:EF hand